METELFDDRERKRNALNLSTEMRLIVEIFSFEYFIF